MKADHIDEVVSSVFDLDSDLLRSSCKHERVTMARMAAMHIRVRQGEDTMVIADLYKRSSRMVAHYIRRADGLLKYDTWFKSRYTEILSFLSLGRLPYHPNNINIGSIVWTRTDSRNRRYKGIVTQINDTTFVVESFLDATYHTEHDLQSGRISDQYETSLDITQIQAP